MRQRIWLDRNEKVNKIEKQKGIDRKTKRKRKQINQSLDKEGDTENNKKRRKLQINEKKRKNYENRMVNNMLNKRTKINNIWGYAYIENLS